MWEPGGYLVEEARGGGGAMASVAAVSAPATSSSAASRSATALVFGPLARIVADPRVTDIAVTGTGAVWVDCGAGMLRYEPDIPFDTSQKVREYAVRLCAQLGKRLDDACPIADASTPEGLRVHAVIEPLVPQGAEISIRIPRGERVSVRSLVESGVIAPQWERVLRGAVRGKANMVVTGATGAGKTTLLRALLAECPDHERIVMVEEVRELGVKPGANQVALACRESNVQGAGGVGLPDLVKATLRMRPDRVVLGECRGEEIADVLRAMNAGHRGGLVTLHADGVRGVPARLLGLCGLAGIDAQTLPVLAQGALDMVVHIRRCGARRYVEHIGVLHTVGGRLVGRALTAWRGEGDIVCAPDWQDFRRRWEIWG